MSYPKLIQYTVTYFNKLKFDDKISFLDFLDDNLDYKKYLSLCYFEDKINFEDIKSFLNSYYDPINKFFLKFLNTPDKCDFKEFLCLIRKLQYHKEKWFSKDIANLVLVAIHNFVSLNEQKFQEMIDQDKLSNDNKDRIEDLEYELFFFKRKY